MNVVFFASDKDREYSIANHFAEGVKKHGDRCDIMPTADYEGPNSETDIAVFIGIKGYSRLIMETHIAAGKHALICDKGYMGGPRGPRSKYVRVSIDDLQPHVYFQSPHRPDDRLKELGVHLQPTKKDGNNIFIAGGSLKYAQWHKFNGNETMDPVTRWASDLINNLSERTQRPLVYSPKPSWKDAVPIKGSRFAFPANLEEEMSNAWAVVSFGSNVGIDALIAGVPNFCLGDGIVRSLSLTNTKKINEPYYPTDEERWKLLSDIAYCQWNLNELKSGQAWGIIKQQIVQLESIKKQNPSENVVVS